MFKRLALMCMAAGALLAGEVVLTDGSVLKGEVSEIFNGKVKVNTDFAGELVIDREKVKSFTTDGAVNLYGTDGQVYAGVVNEEGVKAADGNVTPIQSDAVAILWAEGGKDPSIVEPPTRKWSYEIAGDLTKKSGNSDKRTMGAEAKATMAGPDDKLMFYLRGNYGKEEGIENERSVVGGMDYERNLGETNSSWYFRSEYKYDKYADIDNEITGAAGYGFYFLKSDNAEIRGRVGLSYVNRSYISDMDSVSAFGMDVGYHHDFKFQKMLFMDVPSHFITDVTYVPSFDSFDHDWHLLHESSVSMPLGGSKYWSIRLGIMNDYYSRVAADKDRMDTTYFARLVFSWQ